MGVGLGKGERIINECTNEDKSEVRRPKSNVKNEYKKSGIKCWQKD